MKVAVAGLLALLLPCAAATGQDRQQVAAGPDSADRQRRYQISVMEGVLERAAANGALQTTRRFQAFLSDPLLWNGASRARGFRLDGYGLFFNVEVPALRGSLAWSYQVLAESRREAVSNLGSELDSLREQIKLVADPDRRRALDRGIERIRVYLMGETAPGVLTLRQAAPDQDPNEAYTNDVRNSIIDAMLDHSAPLQIAPDEWFTVAVSDSEPVRISPGQPYELMTITLRVKGSDLAALHAGKLSREEARKRVEISEF
ncbi:MAG: hypothetical protein ACE148_06550 [Vicinamibacterales bacterium]